MKSFIITALLFSLLVTGCVKKPQTQNTNTIRAAEDATVVDQPTKPVVTPEQYEQSLHAALQPFWQEQKIAETKAAVLELTAPSVYLNVHFQVVVALETIEQGQKEADQAKVEEGFDKLNNLAKQYSWLK